MRFSIVLATVLVLGVATVSSASLDQVKGSLESRSSVSSSDSRTERVHLVARNAEPVGNPSESTDPRSRHGYDSGSGSGSGSGQHSNQGSGQTSNEGSDLSEAPGGEDAQADGEKPL